MRDEKMAKKKKEEKTEMNWEGLKQPVKSGVGFRVIVNDSRLLPNSLRINAFFAKKYAKKPQFV